MAYTTQNQINELKRELGITDDAQDGRLVDLLERAAAFIDSYCGRKFSNAVETVTDELRERQGRVLYLRNIGITAVSSVKAKVAQSDDWETLDPSTYEWTYVGRLCLPYPYDYVLVNYSYGTPGVPADILSAQVVIAAESYRGGGANGAIKREELGDLKLEYANSSSSKPSISVLDVLDRHRVRSL